MRRLSINSLAATAVGVLVLAALLLSWGASSDSSEAVFGVFDPTPGSIAVVALDMDGTTAIPSIQSSIATTTPLSKFIDVDVDEVAAIDTMGAWGFNILWDPSVLFMASASTSTNTLGGPTMLAACFQITPPPGLFPTSAPPSPAGNGSGNVRIDCGSIGGAAVGEGTVMSFEMKCVAAGQSPVQLRNFTFKKGPGAPLPVTLGIDGQFGCDGPAATPIDVSLVTETVTGATTMAINTDTAYSIAKEVVSTDAGAGIAATLITTVTAPGTCTVKTGVAGTAFSSAPTAIASITGSVGGTTPAVVTTSVPHGIPVGAADIIIAGTAGTLTGAGDKPVNFAHAATVTGASTLTIPVTSYAAVGAGGTVTLGIGTAVAALTTTPQFSVADFPAVGYAIQCSDSSFHDVVVTNEIFTDAPKLYDSPIFPSNNVITHSTAPSDDDGGNGTAVPQGSSPGEAIRTAVTANADANIDSGGIIVDLSNLNDTDDGVSEGDAAPAELLKGEVIEITIEKDIDLVYSNIFDVTYDLKTDATAPAGCTVSPATQTTSLVFNGAGTLAADQSWDISCTAAGSAPTFVKTWTFDETLTPDDGDANTTLPDTHIIDDDASDEWQELVDIAVIEKFEPVINIEQSSLDDPEETVDLPEAIDECLTTLGCEQEFEETMGPGDPFASVAYTDIPKGTLSAGPGGWSLAADAAVVDGITVGELLDTTTIEFVPFAGGSCLAPTVKTVVATVSFTDEAANPLPGGLQGIAGPFGNSTPALNAYARYSTTIVNFGANGANLNVDIIIEDKGTFYRQWRIINDGDLGADWSTTICEGQVDFAIQGFASDATPTPIRVCDDPNTYVLPYSWIRDDTGGSYSKTDSVNCSALDVSVVMTKDENINVDQGVTTTRDVNISVAGPPDTDLTLSIAGDVECAPRWVAPIDDPAPSVLGDIQTSVITLVDVGSGPVIATYEITCSPVDAYNLQIVANVESGIVAIGDEPNSLNNQAENVVQVNVDADGDNDGIDSPQDNCPTIPNPNQNDADSDGEGNVCDLNDDDDFTQWLVVDNPVNVWTPVLPILDFPLGPGVSVYPEIDLDGPGGNPPISSEITAGPDQCNPGIDLTSAGPDLDALSAAELALWQEDPDDFNLEDDIPFTFAPLGFNLPNEDLDLDGCADTDMSVDLDKDEVYDVNVSENTAKTVEITVTNGNAAVGSATVNLLALSRVGKCEVRWVAEGSDLSSEFQTDELTLTPPIDGPGLSDDYDPTPDGVLDTLQSGLEVSTGPMAAGEVLVLERDYNIHCFQPSDQLWWDSIKENPPSDFNFDATFEIQADVLPDAPVVEEDVSDNVLKNFPLVTAFAIADLKYEFTVTGPTEVPLGVAVDVTGFSVFHNNGPAPTDLEVVGGFVTPPGCGLSLLSGAFLIPPGVATGILPVPLFGAQGAPLPPSVEVVRELDPGSTSIICIEPSFHSIETTLIAVPTWPIQAGNDPEIGDQCQNFIDDDSDGITNDGCPVHVIDPTPAETVFVNNVAALGDTQLNVNVDISGVPTEGNVSEDEFFDVVKTFSQQITPFYNPFLLTGEDGTFAAPPSQQFPTGFFPCADGADNGPDGQADENDSDCITNFLPNSPIFPLITETLAPPPDCSVSYHITNDFLSRIFGGAAGLTISVDGVVVDPPTPAGWEASDVVTGNQGEPVTIDFKIEVTGGQFYEPVTGVFVAIEDAPTVLTENWDKSCSTPSTHDFVMTTNWTSSDMDDPHLPYDADSQEDPFSEDIFAVSDLKIVEDFFTDMEDVSVEIGADNVWRTTFVPAKGSAETGNDCQNSVDDDNDDVINDGCPVEGHQKEALHNNGPYGPTDTTVTIFIGGTGNAAECNVTYDARGDELNINGDTSPTPGEQFPSDSNGEILITFPATLPVSTDVWFAELWRFSSDTDSCIWEIVKTVEADDQHITGAAGFQKFVIVCADNDGDGVQNASSDSPTYCNGPDNCPDAANPGQEDSDNDGLGDVCDPDPDRPPHDGVVKYLITIGPAAINLSDTTGRYMWIIAEVGNQGGPPVTETATVEMTIDEAVPPPDGCTRTPLDDDPADGILTEALVLPGLDTFTMTGDEQKFLVWRVRYECHSPATTQIIGQTVTVTIDIAGDGNPANDSQTVVKTVIID